MYKRAIKLQKEKIRNHYYYKILSYVKKSIIHCKSRGLIRFHLPSVLFGVPKYDLHDLYAFLTKELNTEYIVNIVDNQIVISWQEKQREVAQEVPWILERIDKFIERAIDKHKTEVIYTIPAIIDGVPMFNFKKAFKAVIRILKEDGFDIRIEDKTINKIKISWPEKTVHDIPKGKFEEKEQEQETRNKLEEKSSRTTEDKSKTSEEYPRLSQMTYKPVYNHFENMSRSDVHSSSNVSKNYNFIIKQPTVPRNHKDYRVPVIKTKKTPVHLKTFPRAVYGRDSGSNTGMDSSYYEKYEKGLNLLRNETRRR